MMTVEIVIVALSVVGFAAIGTVRAEVSDSPRRRRIAERGQ